MYWDHFEIAVGFDQAGATTNIEDYIRTPLRGPRVPLGAVTEQAADGWEVTDGFRVVELRQEAIPFAELTAYVTAIHGGWDGDETVEVTLRCRQRDNTFDDFNAYAYLPKEGEDYDHENTAWVVRLRLRYLIIGDAS